jgi:hypothetical protein
VPACLGDKIQSTNTMNKLMARTKNLFRKRRFYTKILVGPVSNGFAVGAGQGSLAAPGEFLVSSPRQWGLVARYGI